MAVPQIALEHRRRYGYRQVTAEFRRRRMVENHKRVARLMEEDQLLALRCRASFHTPHRNATRQTQQKEIFSSAAALHMIARIE